MSVSLEQGAPRALGTKRTRQATPAGGTPEHTTQSLGVAPLQRRHQHHGPQRFDPETARSARQAPRRAAQGAGRRLEHAQVAVATRPAATWSTRRSTRLRTKSARSWPRWKAASWPTSKWPWSGCAAASYGVCEICNGKIPLARLTALPYATSCIECQRATENAGGGAGYAGDWSRVLDGGAGRHGHLVQRPRSV